jgi:DNA modification methylase
MASTPDLQSDRYRVIVVPLNAPLSPEGSALVRKVGAGFKPGDLSLSLTGTSLICHLHALTPGQLRDRIQVIGGAFWESSLSGAVEVLRELANLVDRQTSYSIHDGKRVYAGYTAERRVIGRTEKVRRRGGCFYMGDHQFSREENRLSGVPVDSIVCGDSEEVLARLPDNCVDLVLTSPPYNFGLSYRGGDDGQHWEEYFSKLFSILDQCVRVLKFGGRCLVNIQPLFSDNIPTHHLISQHLLARRMIWKGEILWEKNNYNCKYTAWGSWKSPSAPYLKYTWEFIEIFSKGDLKKPGKREQIDITADEFKAWVVARWSIGPERQMKRYHHPAMFPEELVERALKLFTYQGDLILDPFNGAGTTTLVARRLQRRFIGVDISPEYCATARERLENR